MSIMSLSLNTDLITIQEKNKISLQIDHSNSSEENKIHSCYNTLEKKEKTKVKISLVKNIIEDVGKGITASVLVGASAFGIFGLLIGGPSGFVGGVKLGAKLGTVGGALDGGLRGIKEFKVEFMASEKYKEWVEEARKTDVYPIFRKVVEGDKRFDDFNCSLSYDLICVPVRAPDGRLYEQQNIVAWIKQKEEVIKQAMEAGAMQDKIDEIRETLSPIRAKVGSFTVDDLKYCPEYFIKLDQLAKIKISEMENDETKRIFTSAMQTIQSGQIDDRMHIIKEQIFEVQRYVRKHKLDPSISTKICEKLLDELEKIELEESTNKVE
jgi:hypothetical protein